MTERIQKILSSRGVASRRAAEEMIKAGRITCNGQVCTLGQSADPDMDEILVDGKALPSPSEKVYIMLHKPRGYVTTLSDEKGRPDAASLVSCGQRVYPVGRLDMDSEGLMLFTNDGEFANRMMHPSHEVKKVYEVWVSGFTRDGLRILQEPMELDGYRIRRPGVRILKEQESKAVLEVTIHEGRNRQVRRMCDHAGMQVTRLKRVAEGRLKLGKLELGKWRYLTEEELEEITYA